MFITRKRNENHPQFCTYYFPYKIGLVQDDGRMARRWRPVDTSQLTGGLPESDDTFGVNAKLSRLGEHIRESYSEVPIEWVDIADKQADKMQLVFQTHESMLPYYVKEFEKWLTSAFGLEIP